MSKRIYVGYFAPETSRGELEKLFSSFGPVVSVSLTTDRQTGRPSGFGFVEMKNPKDADAALKGLEGRSVGGRRIKTSTRPLDTRPRTE